MEIIEQTIEQATRNPPKSRVEIGRNDVKRARACIRKRGINVLVEQECNKPRSTDWIQLGSVNLQDMRLGVAP